MISLAVILSENYSILPYLLLGIWFPFNERYCTFCTVISFSMRKISLYNHLVSCSSSCDGTSGSFYLYDHRLSCLYSRIILSISFCWLFCMSLSCIWSLFFALT